MKCERCREHDATTFWTIVENQEVRKKSLCDQCSQLHFEFMPKPVMEAGWTSYNPPIEQAQDIEHTVTCFDRAGDWESDSGIPTTSLSHLNAVLDEYSVKSPRIIDLQSSTGNLLQLGIGGEYGSAQFIRANNMPPYLMAKANPIRARRSIEFVLGGTPTPVLPRFCLSFEDVVKIAGYFFRTSVFDPEFKWAEV